MSVLGRAAVPVLNKITLITKASFFEVASFNYHFFFSLLMLIIQYVEAKPWKGNKHFVSWPIRWTFLSLNSPDKRSQGFVAGLWCGLSSSGALSAARSCCLGKPARGQCCVSSARALSSLSSLFRFVYPVPWKSFLLLHCILCCLLLLLSKEYSGKAAGDFAQQQLLQATIPGTFWPNCHSGQICHV